MLGRGLGGLEQGFLDYQEALSQCGHDVHSLIHPDAEIRPELENSGAAWHPLPQHGAWDLVAVVRLRRLLQELRPNACIAHGNRAMSLLRRAGADRLIAVLPNYKMKCEGAAAVFHPTADLKRHALERGVPEFRLHHIPYMVRVSPVPRARAWGQPPVIGAMGRFVAKKGFTSFIAALGRLHADGFEFHAVLAGDGPERVNLEQLAGQQGLSDRLGFPGWVHDKAAFFAGIDVFCLPSLHEPFGIVLLEAMAQAKPIVATDSEGPAEILHNGVDGIIVPRGDAEGLAGALRSLLAAPQCAASLGSSAYHSALEQYDISRVGARLDAALQSVTQHRAEVMP